jgi:hypothetical protein
MNAKLRLSLLLLAIGIAIAWPCLISPQSASAQATVITDNVRLPLIESGSLPGLGAYYLEAEVQLVYHMTALPNGEYNAVFHQSISHFNGYLIDLDMPFQGQSVFSAHETSAPNTGPPPYEGSIVQTFTAITPGKTINIVIHITTHYTVNANGDITANVEDVVVE